MSKADERVQRLERENAALARALAERDAELAEARAQQTATAEVLGVINSSPGDLAPVFDALLERALRLGEAAFGALYIRHGEFYSGAATRNLPPQLAEIVREPFKPSPSGFFVRAFRGDDVEHILDLRAEGPRATEDPRAQAIIHIGGARTVLTLALRMDSTVLGAFSFYRQEVRPFSDKQIALLKNFSAQAVIAMENARLITETREALEQQTATGDVLKVISRSAFDLQPVLDTVVAAALRLCRADHSGIYRNEGGVYRWAAGYLQSPEYERIERTTDIHPGTGTLVGRTALEGRPVQIIDALTDPLYEAKDGLRTSGAHTLLGVPLLREGLPIGVIGLGRNRIEAFSDKEIALVTTFADQAVIAIENARLISETREALEQQTATAEVLGVINSSPGDLAPVFDAILEKAHSLCGVASGTLQLYDGETFRAAAVHGLPEAHAEWLRQGYRPGPNLPQARLLAGDQLAHVADLAEIDDPNARTAVELGRIRTLLCVALRKDDTLLGMISATRFEVRPFSEKEIALLQNFAAQAVIAMENARLISETRQRTSELQESLEYQTATSDVLKVISRSTFDLQPVLDTLVETGARLCSADGSGLTIRDGDIFRYVAIYAMGDELFKFLQQRTFAPGRDTMVGRVALGGKVVHIEDIAADPEYALPESMTLGKAHTLLGVPLLRDGGVVGTLNLTRRRIEPFTERQIELVQTFADQAVIAIENARLLTETRTARDDAEGALRELKAAQANLIQAEKMASLGQLTAGIAHEIKNPLNFVNNFAGLSNELLGELKDIAAPAIEALDPSKRAELDETMEMLSDNLDKIAEHGRRADGIVRSMLAHSRGGSGERQIVDLNALLEESLNLAYHGARAQDQSFNITLEREFDRALKPIELVPQDMTRVFLNLFGNGFYAAHKRAHDNSNPGFRPVLHVATHDSGVAVEIRVRDNGTGIPADIRDKLFQPFFTTKPTGEGTGLGLSISYDIVTQQHGGTIDVDSQLGEFTEFTIRLPRGGGPPTSGITA